MALDLVKLQEFINKASAQTYAGGGQEVTNPERAGFNELVFSEEEFSYRDSYAGYFRSWGTELVRVNNQPMWNAVYGGGMVEKKEDLASETFSFLKKAFLKRDQDSFRGPKELIDRDWRYVYQQEGDISRFSGMEEIYFKGELVFFHNIIGGLIIS